MTSIHKEVIKLAVGYYYRFRLFRVMLIMLSGHNELSQLNWLCLPSQIVSIIYRNSKHLNKIMDLTNITKFKISEKSNKNIPNL